MGVSPDANRARAAELAARARELHEGQEYAQAAELYLESLHLHDDDEVRAAYLAVIAAIGPT